MLPPGVRTPLAEADQPEQDPPSDVGLGGGEPLQGGVGPARQRYREPAPHAIAQRVVVREGERLIAARIPQLHQGLLQERQDPRLGGGIGDEPFDQLGFDGHAHALGRRGDGLAQGCAAQRGHIDPRQLRGTLGPQGALHKRTGEVRS